MQTLLVIDDDPLIVKGIDFAFVGEGVAIRPAMTAADAIADFQSHRPNAVLSDIRLPDLSGLDLLARLKVIDPAVPVVLMTGHGTAGTAIEAMRRGAFDYVLKPFDPDQLTELVLKAFEVNRLMRVPALLLTDDESDAADGDQFIGRSPSMQDVFKAVGRAAPTDATVLILGESGTGKELVARSIVHYSKRAGQPFQALNCAAIPEALLESELFGHEKGSFTGADRKRIGRFEQCHGGTIFLDEIGDMSLLTQGKILRLIQEQRFERVGGGETIQTDVRLIAATHRNLEAMIAAGTFREDLYYRLNVCPIHLPPLRDRADDIPLLVRHFLKRYGRDFGEAARTITPEALEALKAFPWPGNVRQLQSVIKQSLLRTAGSVLTVDCLPPDFKAGGRCPRSSAADATPGEPNGGAVLQFVRDRLGEGSTDLHAEVVAWVERTLLTEVLQHTHGNLSHAATVLGITRPTLRVKLNSLGIAVENHARVVLGGHRPIVGR